jgi:HrpA-like RNA helicase
VDASSGSGMMMVGNLPTTNLVTEEVEEKTEFNLELTLVPADKKIPILKIVRSITGLGLKEAKDLVDSAPKNIQENGNMINKTIRKYIKLPKDKYEFYDEYLPEELKESFNKPIGLYDPFGENINPLTNAPYENIYKDTTDKYHGGPAEGITYNKTYLNWAYNWTNFPLYSIVGTILNSIRQNTVTIIKAGTGVGKSFLAGRICCQAFNFQENVLMTLPKKLLAREAAETTAITCDVRIGEEVGYYFKGEYNIDKNNKKSKIVFTTTGSLIRKITGDDPYLSEYSCIIIDEAHERTVQTDELILFLKKTLIKRTDLKIVFISATLNVDEFKKYYKDYSFNVVDMGDGTTKKIIDYYEQKKPMDWQKVAIEKVMKILRAKEIGDIIVFIKSGGDAGKMRQYLEPQIKTLEDNENPYIAVLDASVSKEDKDYAIKEFDYKTHPNQNPNKPYTRKIVFATNVAESSLTIKGAVFVIDCGLALEDIYFPENNANALLEKFVSKSAVKQRRGRVGRTMDGTCYHLYSEKELSTFIDYPLPSILKSNLTMDILDVMKIEYIKNIADVKKLLNEMISPPEKRFLDSALHNLYSMGAITSKDDTGIITDLGKAMTKFSGIPIYFTKAIIASYYYHCKYEIIPIIVMVELLKGRIESLYTEYRPKTKLSESNYKKEVDRFKKQQHRFDSKYGDFLTLHNIYTEFRNFIKTPQRTESNGLNGRNGRNRQMGQMGQMNGGLLNNENNNKTNSESLSNANNNLYKKVTKSQAKKWCEMNGFRANIFINFRDNQRWDKIGNESRKIDQVLMEIVQPADNKLKKYKEYKENGGKSTKKELKEDAVMLKKEMTNIDPENKILIGEEEEIDIPKNKIKKSLLKNNSEIIQFGGNNSSIPTIGYQNKGYERKYFPTAKMFKTKEENILMSLAHGLYINIAKHISQKRYITCYPIKKTFCLPDPKTTMPLTQMPSFLFYNELFMMREGQKDLKLNFITKFPTIVTDEIKVLYEKYIGDCYKKIDFGRNNTKKSFKKDRGKKKGQQRGQQMKKGQQQKKRK